MRLEGKRLLITSGPTRGHIDRVRFITNKSTGRLGVLIAEEALEAGAQVTFIYGKGSLTPDPHAHLRLIEIQTVGEVLVAAQQELTSGHYDAIIHLMAVLDYEPVEFVPDKTPSGREEWVVPLKPTPKVIARMKEWAPDALLVGFKLEDHVSDEELITAARALAERTGAALVVANNLTEIEQGHHRTLFVASDGSLLAEVVGKEAIAEELTRTVVEMLRGRP